MGSLDPLNPAAESDVAVFLSASIPDPERWTGEFDAYEITEAVTAAARVVLANGWDLVTAAHPTVAPMLLYVAAEVSSGAPSSPRVVVYQSELFRDMLPKETRRFQDDGIGRLVWTAAAEGETPAPDSRSESLATMRDRMLRETNPAAAVFIGGMDGILDEASMFGEMFPDRPQYALGRPGGAARTLAEAAQGALADLLRDGDVYPTIFRQAFPTPSQG